MNLNRNIIPKQGSKILFQLPEIKKIILENGLEVLFVQKDNLPIIQLKVITSAGSFYDPLEKKGLAYLTASLIDEGAGEYSALELDDEIEKLGSVLSISVDHDSILFSMTSLSENIDRSTELLAKILTHPRFHNEEFDREKKKLSTKITQLKDEPSYIANSSFEKLIFNSSPYSFPTIGYEDTVNNISNDDIKEFYRIYLNTNNSKMVVVGNIEFQILTDMLNNHLRGWKKSGQITKEKIQVKPTNTRLCIVHRDGSAQSEIRIGHVTSGRNTKDYFAKTIMNSILGGQFSSRINLNLREDKGFTYGAGSAFHYKKDIGFFSVSTAVHNENTGAAVNEILKELDLIRKEIDREEIEFAKSSLIKSFPLMFETYTQIAGNLSHLIIHSLPENYYHNYIENLDRQSGNAILQAAKENLHTDQLCILAVGDKHIIKSQLEKITGLNASELNINGNLIDRP